MKHLTFLTLAAAALFAASCSNEVITEVTDQPTTPERAISFETFSSNATRAENSTQTKTDNLYPHHETFSLWGYKDVTTAAVFTAQTVNGATNGATQPTYSWTYTPVRFWDNNANTYQFYACAPQNATFAFHAPAAATQDDGYFTTGTVTIEDETLADTEYNQFMKANTKNTDLMVASPCPVQQQHFGQTVQLHFNHILSRLNITVRKGQALEAVSQDCATNNAADAGELKIVSLQVFNMTANGVFNENAVQDPMLTAGTAARWTRANNVTVNYTANNYGGAAIPFVDGTTVTTPVYLLQSLVMPQEVEFEAVKRDGSDVSTASKPYLRIEYTIGATEPETFVAYYNLANAFGKTENLPFNEGWQNTLNITIDGATIVFDADVYQWADYSDEDLQIN